MANRRPHLDSKVLTISDLQIEGSRNVSSANKEYFNEGAGDMITLRDNEEAYNRYKLRPRVLNDVDGVDTSTTIFGIRVAGPFGFAPSAAHKLAHPDGELATSRAACANNIPMCLSSYATVSLEDVKAAGGENPYAMQITFVRDLRATQDQIHRAERAGYKAIFVSVDIPILGRRLNESRNNFSFPPGLEFPNIRLPSGDGSVESLVTTKSLDYGKFCTRMRIQESTTDDDRSKHHMEEGYSLAPGSDKDADMAQRRFVVLSLYQKGFSAVLLIADLVYTPEDVKLAVAHGLDGVIISNHGGRQLDGVPATLDALRDCAPAAAGKIPLAIDGGIRRGSDLFKAIALGAQFCFIGRVVIWGLAYNGEKGVSLAVQILLDELKQTMMLCGCKTISDINKGHLSVLKSDGILSKL